MEATYFVLNFTGNNKFFENKDLIINPVRVYTKSVYICSLSWRRDTSVIDRLISSRHFFEHTQSNYPESMEWLVAGKNVWTLLCEYHFSLNLEWKGYSNSYMTSCDWINLWTVWMPKSKNLLSRMLIITLSSSCLLNSALKKQIRSWSLSVLLPRDQVFSHERCVHVWLFVMGLKCIFFHNTVHFRPLSLQTKAS